VLLCNEAAQGHGIRPGMSLTAARALARDLIIQPRNHKAEQAALHSLSVWSYQFSSQVSLHPPCALLLEVQGSLVLFGGRIALLGKLRTGLAELGYQVQFAGAPTPLAALSLARCQREHMIEEQHQLKLQAGCERIESGWWDEQDVARDYFIAINPSGSCYWIYRELTGERRWYLQGIFE